MSPQVPSHVCFIGGGTMGCYNALLAALAGYDAVIYDISRETLRDVPKNIAAMSAELVATGLQDSRAIEAAALRIATQGDLKIALSGAKLVSESIFENLEVKRELFAKLDGLCSDDVILTTNSSSLMVADIEGALDNGARFAALHSHLGAMLFDIVPGPRTSPETTDFLREYVERLGGVSLVLKKENKGYVFNAMIGPVLTTAMLMVIDHVATVHEVDRAWMTRTQSPMGPFGMIDLFGTALIYDSWKHRPENPAMGDIRLKILSFMAPIVGSGRLGMKSGHGFYDYPDPAYTKAGFLDGNPETSAADYALTSAWTQNAVLIAANEVADPYDIDRAWITATRQPKGPFAVLDDIGLDRAMILFGSTGPLAGPENIEKVTNFLAPRLAQGQSGVKSGSGFYDYPDPAYASEGFIKGGDI
jgi:3-hydroxybutyryl-CoA dehydrogenase